MIENLFCYALLLKSELITFYRYEEYLNDIFFKEPDNDLLLELQYLTSECCATVNLINEEFCRKEVDVKCFGVILMQELKNVYYTKSFGIEEFGRKTYLLWKNIPYDIGKEEPFHTLSYADDPLSWGDVNQTCKLYEELFEYYK